MDWTVIAAIAEVVGVVCLIGSLIYLGMQIRQNTAMVRANTELEAGRLWAELHARVAHSPDMADIWDKGLTDHTRLSPAEKRKFIWLIAEFFVMTETHFRQWKHGFLSADTWQVYRSTAAGALGNPLVRSWWASGVSPYAVDFREEMDRAVRELGDQTWNYKPLSEL